MNKRNDLSNCLIVCLVRILQNKPAFCMNKCRYKCDSNLMVIHWCMRRLSPVQLGTSVIFQAIYIFNTSKLMFPFQKSEYFQTPIYDETRHDILYLKKYYCLSCSHLKLHLVVFLACNMKRGCMLDIHTRT